MKAEDTVMTENYMTMIGLKNKNLDDKLLAQAEISLKAGIKEVVELIGTDSDILFDEKKWQAQLKEWGIKEDSNARNSS